MATSTSKELEKILELIYQLDKKRVSIEDFKEIVATLAAHALATRQASEAASKAIDESAKNTEKLLKETIEKTTGTFRGEVERRLNDAISSVWKTVDELKKEQKQTVDYLYDKATSLRSIKGDPGKDADPNDVADIVVNRLDIPRGIGGIVKSHDERLDEVEEDIKKLKRRPAGGGIKIFGSGSSGGNKATYYDLSSALDGVTKTFSLPAFYKIISVHTSSFPHILRPTTDYTSDASAFTITFTSEIDAATTLATGQSVIILYAEP